MTLGNNCGIVDVGNLAVKYTNHIQQYALLCTCTEHHLRKKSSNFVK